MNQCRTHAERYERLVILERMHEISVLLVELGQDAWLDGEGTGPHDPIDPLDGPREARLRTAQNHVQLGSWTDGSPMLNTGWMLSLNQIMYDPAYELRFGPSIGTAADIVALLRALGKTPVRDARGGPAASAACGAGCALRRAA